MKIRYSKLRSTLHNDEFLKRDEKEFIEEINKELNEVLLESELEDYNNDLKLILIESGGSEGLFLSQINKMKEPYYLLAKGTNNSLAASLEILTYLNDKGLSGEILHGNAKYIAGRIKELARVNKAKEKLKATKLGVIGKPSDWLIASVGSYDEIKSKTGIELIDISIDEVIKEYNSVDSKDYVEAKLLKFDTESLKKAKRVSLALDNIKAKYNLNGLTIRCFDLLSSIKTTSCLALAKLNSEGVIGTCEGDIASMLTMTIANYLTDELVFQCNPSVIDVTNKKITFAHCTIPLTMGESYKLDTHYESGIGVAIKAELRCDDVTVIRFDKNLNKAFIEEGRIIKNLNESNLCRTQIDVEFDNNISDILKHPCGNHHIVIYGRHKDIISAYFKSINE